MGNRQERGFDEKLNTWVQTIGIIIAALWAGYVFFYKEIKVPEAAPVNVTIDLALQKTGTFEPRESKDDKRLMAVEIRVTAKNPSSRSINLLPSVFIVRGIKFVTSPGVNFIEKICSKPICSSSEGYMIRHSSVKEVLPVAMGKLLNSDTLNPGEIEKDIYIFHVPQGEYDVLEARTFIPSARHTEGIDLEWHFIKDTGKLKTKIFRISRKGERTLIDEKDLVKLKNEIEMQYTKTIAMLSLW